MRTILVVEDDEDTGDFLQEFLSMLGYDAVLVENGLQALDYLKLSSPTAILSDIMMPVMGGLELCQQLAQHDHDQTIPLILTSSSFRPQELNKYPNVAFISKPLLITELPAMLEHIAESI